MAANAAGGPTSLAARCAAGAAARWALERGPPRTKAVAASSASRGRASSGRTLSKRSMTCSAQATLKAVTALSWSSVRSKSGLRGARGMLAMIMPCYRNFEWPVEGLGTE